MAPEQISADPDVDHRADIYSFGCVAYELADRRRAICASKGESTICRAHNGEAGIAEGPWSRLPGRSCNARDEVPRENSVPGLTVASRNAAVRLRNVDAAQVGHALDVGGVIEGTARRFGGPLKLTAQLTDVRSGKIVWADSCEQQAQDVFAVEDTIAKAIVAALQLRLNPRDAKPAGVTNAQGTSDLAAYDLYLRAEYLLARRGKSFYSALKLFEQATETDPKFARAYAGYAMAASVLPGYSKTPADSIVPLGLRAAKRAIDIDRNLADAHLGMANLRTSLLTLLQIRAGIRCSSEQIQYGASADVRIAIG